MLLLLLHPPPAPQLPSLAAVYYMSCKQWTLSQSHWEHLVYHPLLLSTTVWYQGREDALWGWLAQAGDL